MFPFKRKDDEIKTVAEILGGCFGACIGLAYRVTLLLAAIKILRG